MEMRILFLITIFLTNSLLFGQDDNEWSPLDPGRSFISLLYGRLQFFPSNEPSNRLQTNYCIDSIDFFYLNGLLLNKEQFLGIELSPKHLSNDKSCFLDRFKKGVNNYGYGIYNSNFMQKDSCIYQRIFTLNVDLLFFVNGDELSIDEQDSVLSTIKTTDILAIKRERYLFKKGEIHIITK
tara:strand:- start:1387 stop:1929 length:543 start_codon:yes stop_codon:yes gene_type:complete